jgi:hypothetical protein
MSSMSTGTSRGSSPVITDRDHHPQAVGDPFLRRRRTQVVSICLSRHDGLCGRRCV